jgi:hypothetical protein
MCRLSHMTSDQILLVANARAPLSERILTDIRETGRRGLHGPPVVYCGAIIEGRRVMATAPPDRERRSVAHGV